MADISDTELVAILILLEEEDEKKKQLQRRFSVHPLNELRPSRGQFHSIYESLRSDKEKFFSYYRMSSDSFDELHDLIKNKIAKSITFKGEPISAKERLTVTLRYLATGSNFADLQYVFLMGRSTIAAIVKETCQVLWDVLNLTEMTPPSTEEWQKISDEYYNRTKFPNCLGSVDGKHIRLVKPACSGSEYFNYKKYNSIILMAIADANYRFIAIDVGSYGREGDATVFKNSSFGKRIINQNLNIPPNRSLPNTTNPELPYVFVGDEAFALHCNILRPYPRKNLTDKRRIFNYRLSATRRYIECAFGILSNKWRALHTSLTVAPDFAVIIVKAACVLHNFVRSRDGYNFQESLTCDMSDISVQRTSCTVEGREVRDTFADYFMSPDGEVPWQYRFINNHNQ